MTSFAAEAAAEEANDDCLLGRGGGAMVREGVSSLTGGVAMTHLRPSHKAQHALLQPLPDCALQLTRGVAEQGQGGVRKENETGIRRS